MARASNPPSGSAFTLAFGESVELSFELENNNDNLTPFSAQLSGLDRAWTKLDRATGTAGAYGVCQVAIHIEPSADASAGEYSFRVSFLERDEACAGEP